MKKILNWTLVAVVSLGGVAACGSDEEKSSPTTAAVAETDTDATTGGEVASGNPAVTEYCEKADDLAAKLKDVVADPTSADAAAVTASATELTTAAATLITANPADAAAITACSQKITDALTP